MSARNTGGSKSAKNADMGATFMTLKDAHVVLEQGKRVGQPLPLTAITTALLQACVAHGEGERQVRLLIEIHQQSSNAGVSPLRREASGEGGFAGPSLLGCDCCHHGS